MSKEYFYSLNGEAVEGPHTAREIAELALEGVLASESHVIRAGEPNWRKLSEYQEIISIRIEAKSTRDEDSVSVAVVAGTSSRTAEDQEESSNEEAATKTKRKSRHAMLRGIRATLDQLWSAQREAIIARIKADDLDVQFEATRKQHKDLYAEIEATVLEYWRADGILTEWIRDLTWNDADFTLKLKGATEAEKFEEVTAWLISKNLYALPAVYCFIDGKDYIYVGQAKEVGARLKQHEQKTFFSKADKIRVVIPQNKRMLNKLERMVILNRQPMENRSGGYSKNNPADDCLEFIRREIKELISDF